VIRDMLQYSFTHPDRLLEAMHKSKWIKRVSGFYRCTTDEKGFFASLSWDASNLHYLECACSVYKLLVEDPQGLAFLKADRRGVLFNDISKEIKDIFDSSVNSLKFASTSGFGLGSSKSSSVFRLQSCQQTMAREYFALLGRMTLVDAGRSLLDETPLVYTLSLIGTSRPLDYLSRLAISSLAFTDNGYMSQLLIKSWWASGKCSSELKLYTVNLLSALCDSRPLAFREWGIDVIVAMLSFEDPAAPMPQLVRLLQRMVEVRENIIVFLSKSPINVASMRGPGAEAVRVRLLSTPEGIAFLSQQQARAANEGVVSDQEAKCIHALLDAWQALDARQYVRRVDALMVKTLRLAQGQIKAMKVQNGGGASSGSSSSNPPRQGQLIKPIVLPVRSLVSLNAGSGEAGFEGTPMLAGSSSSSLSGGAGQQQQQTFQSFLESSTVSLEGMLRVPWNIEVKLIAQSGGVGPTAAGPAAGAPEFLKVDCFVDTSDFHSPASFDVTSDEQRVLRLRGIILDEKGLPSGRPVSTSKSVLCCLLAGVAPVSRDGVIFSMGAKDSRTARRKSANISSSMLRGTDSMSTITKRQSLVSGSIGGGSASNASAAAAAAAIEAEDAVTSVYESTAYDWSCCKPGHRQGRVIELGDNRFSVEIAGEPCEWIFSRSLPGAPSAPRYRAGSLGNVFGAGTGAGADDGFGFGADGSSRGSAALLTGRASDASRSGTGCYLVEVVYHMRVDTGLVSFCLPIVVLASFFASF